MVAAVVLAAGAASRFGGPKQALLLPEVLRRVRESSVADVLVVTGAHPLETDARVVRCPDWELGPGASLRCGLAALDEDVEAGVVVLADGPDLSPEAIDRVVEAWPPRGARTLSLERDSRRGRPGARAFPHPMRRPRVSRRRRYCR